MDAVSTRMTGIPLRCWEDFEEISLKAVSDTKGLIERRGSHVDYPLFRGAADSRYRLQTSLERLGQVTTLSEYHKIVKTVGEYVETCTGKRWNINTKVSLGELDWPAYEFMAYLRQNGFPSPLLDWTKSPYIAAFFAFRNIYRKPEDREYVSVFVFREYCGNGKSWSSENPHIHTFGPSIATCRTHYLQQSEYSVCVRREDDGETHFANYEDVGYDKDDEGSEQDVLVKYNIPTSEQTKVLRILDLMNITAYSLFDSEPSLMDTLALREFVVGV